MNEPAATKRVWHIVAAAAVAVAAAGYFTGTREISEGGAPVPPGAPAASAPVPSYAEMGAVRRGANANHYAGAFDALQIPDSELMEPVEPTEADRARALAARAGRRAYNGAPPTIPHDIAQKGFPDCLVCHERGARIAGKLAPRMSHERLEGCPQCHVPSSSPPLSEPKDAVDNVFVGLETPGPGERAWPGAPPTIPHTTWMRSQCSSCHGVAGAFGLRTTHPWRQSCTQCHAPSALLDQRTASQPPPLPGVNP
jgi:cytochrome c-type protein NapB